jgi:hypothetical protein
MYVVACHVCGGMEPYLIALFCSLPIVGGFIKMWYNRIKAKRCSKKHT